MKKLSSHTMHCTQFLGNGPNTVSESTVSNTEFSEFFGAHWVLGSELSEFLSAYYLCAKANSPSFSQNSPSLPQNSVSSLLQNSTLETVFRPFPSCAFVDSRWRSCWLSECSQTSGQDRWVRRTGGEARLGGKAARGAGRWGPPESTALKVWVGSGKKLG